MRSILEGHRNPANGRVHGDYTWCSQCEQARATEDWARGAWFCPARCGGTGLDALPWEFVRQGHPEHPAQPRAGRHYLWHGSGVATDGREPDEMRDTGSMTGLRLTRLR